MRSDASFVELAVEDDGGGFEPAHAQQGDHQGLRNMKARAEALGGSLVVDSAPGRGTRLVARIPIREDVPDD
jgi:signal transduction histidine kinase